MIEIIIYRQATFGHHKYIFRKIVDSLPQEWHILIGKRTKIYLDNSYGLDSSEYNDLLQWVMNDEENLETFDEYLENLNENNKYYQELLKPITTQIIFYEASTY